MWYSASSEYLLEDAVNLLIATGNQGKCAEYQAILDGLDLHLLTLGDVGIEMTVEETGQTFAENALLKASTYARMADLWTLADDSGLEVDALGGAPGVYSARFGGGDLTDAQRCDLLLAHLEGVPTAERAARFRCVIALVGPCGREETVQGACEGRVALEPAGDKGFGYDPVFYLPDLDRTMAELAPEHKNAISHRAHAGAEARNVLLRWLG